MPLRVVVRLVFLVRHGGLHLGFLSTPNGWGEPASSKSYSAPLPELSQFRRHPVKVAHREGAIGSAANLFSPETLMVGGTGG
jgi:hypothetical protein